MKIGDRVKTTKIGPITEGIVKGYIDPKYFSKWYEGTTLQPNYSESRRWHELFPGFMDKPLVFVEFNQKHFVMNDDDIRFNENNGEKFDLHEGWIKSTMYYPIDALEVVDQ